MQRFAWCVLACVSPLTADAAELFRCVARNGDVSIQDVPCDADSRLTKTIAVPDATAHKERRPKTMKRAKAKHTASNKRTPIKSDARERRRQDCEAARAGREQALDTLGLERTFDQLRTLDDRVHEHCKGL